jgi:hypothetical protein
MKNPKFIELALATGGSHYPEVGGKLLEQFAEMIVRECADIAQREKDNPHNSILSHYGLE